MFRGGVTTRHNMNSIDDRQSFVSHEVPSSSPAQSYVERTLERSETFAPNLPHLERQESEEDLTHRLSRRLLFVQLMFKCVDMLQYQSMKHMKVRRAFDLMKLNVSV